MASSRPSPFADGARRRVGRDDAPRSCHHRTRRRDVRSALRLRVRVVASRRAAARSSPTTRGAAVGPERRSRVIDVSSRLRHHTPPGAASAADKKRAVRAAQLAWHPDKCESKRETVIVMSRCHRRCRREKRPPESSDGAAGVVIASICDHLAAPRARGPPLPF